ncbi:hypothetical protein GF357_01405 [Candidatus Dojkabacteria bacterium]|nr:hypothetical protein [Candidatus Dojkabacteria bacterium]
MAHLKLDITLAETGYDVSKGKGKRLGVYLTNSLEEPQSLQRDLFSQWLSTESLEANEVKKEKPIMVVMGNPPYAVSSTNKGEWIQNLIEDYKKDLNEKKINLDDDYIKFIRYAQWFIEKNGEGVVAYISNNSFIDGITHRQMRKSLLETFDKIYILNLHGNSLKKEKTPNGGKDENVFDIRQGVSINIFVKKKEANNKLAEVYYSDVWGERKKKYQELKNQVNEIRWKKIKYRKTNFFFVIKNYELLSSYKKGLLLSNIFRINNSGIQTDRDSLFIDSDRDNLKQKMKLLFNDSDEKFCEKYRVKNSSSYKIVDIIKKVDLEVGNIEKILYRPFDFRYIYYSPELTSRPAGKVMEHILGHKNIVLISSKQQSTFDYQHAFVSDRLLERCTISLQTKEGGYNFPLYLYDKTNLHSSTRQPNLDQKIIDQIATKLDLSFIPDHEDPKAGKKGTFNPLDILDYIYAILHSPTYRERYKEFLKIDFPRIPFTSDKKLFWKLVKKGRELREFHLMEHEKSDNLITTFPVAGDNEITRRITKTSPGFELTDKKKKIGRVWINDDQYFDNVPELAWNFYIGGYQPAQKWLKDRRDMKLDNESARHYQKIIVALVNTDRIMKEIDGLIDKWPIE